MKNRLVLAAALSLAATWAAASPLDPAAEVPPVRYRSAFADYRPFDDASRADWREVNRVVEEAARTSAGGHAGHGAAPVPPQPAASMPGRVDQGSGHHGHGSMHGGAK